MLLEGKVALVTGGARGIGACICRVLAENGAAVAVNYSHGTGDEIGKACVFFLSDLAGYVTGAYLPVAGGRITQMGA